MTSYLKYRQQMAVMDADDPDIESWITVRGNHIPIKKGQTKEEAVKSFLESKGNGGKTGTTKRQLNIHSTLKEYGSQKLTDTDVSWNQLLKRFESGETLKKITGYPQWKIDELYGKMEYMTGKSVKELKQINKEARQTGKPDGTEEAEFETLEKQKTESKQEQKADTYTYKKGEEVEFYTDVMHDDLAKGKIVGFERSMASHGHKAENQYVIEMPDGSTRTINEKQIDWAKERKTDEPADPKTEFQNEFKGTKWNAGNGYATYVDNDYRFEIYREGDMYVATVTNTEDYDDSDIEEEEMFSTLKDARKRAEEFMEEYAEPSDEAKMEKVNDVRRIVSGSVRYEKVGKVMRLTGYYSGGSVDLDFEKLTGHSPNNSVRYEMEGSVLTISDYYGTWEKKIDFDKLTDEQVADLIRK